MPTPEELKLADVPPSDWDLADVPPAGFAKKKPSRPVTPMGAALQPYTEGEKRFANLPLEFVQEKFGPQNKYLEDALRFVGGLTTGLADIPFHPVETLQGIGEATKEFGRTMLAASRHQPPPPDILAALAERPFTKTGELLTPPLIATGLVRGGVGLANKIKSMKPAKDWPRMEQPVIKDYDVSAVENVVNKNLETMRNSRLSTQEQIKTLAEDQGLTYKGMGGDDIPMNKKTATLRPSEHVIQDPVTGSSFGVQNPTEFLDRWAEHRKVNGYDVAGNNLTLAQPVAPVKPKTLSQFEAVKTDIESTAPKIQARAAELADKITELTDPAKILFGETGVVKETGTLTPETRVQFREAGGKPPEVASQALKVSANEVRSTVEQVVGMGEELARLQRLTEATDPLTRAGVASAQNALKDVLPQAVAIAERFKKERFAANRVLQVWNQAVKEGKLAAAQQAFRSAGVALEAVREIKPREPLFNNIANGIKNWKNLKTSEKAQVGRDLVDFMRFNMFSLTSGALDLIGNAAATTGRVLSAGGEDLFHLLGRGKADAPALRGHLWALRDRWITRKKIPTGVEEGLGYQTATGELIPGLKLTRGEGFGDPFTKYASKGVDIVGLLPLRSKGFIDTGFRRFGATASLWTEAIKAADKQKLSGLSRDRFIQEFFENPPKDAMERAIQEGKELGFNRQLSSVEEKIAGSVMVRLLADGFARWPFQFTRWAGEMFGADPKFYGRVRNGTATIEDLGGYLTKAASGWGSLYLLQETLYDRVDAKTMEYINDEGNRVRLAGREPMATGLWLLAAIHGDRERASNWFKYTSLPLAKFISGEGGGILSDFVLGMKSAIDNPHGQPRQLANAVEERIRLMFPGQAVLSALKSVFDPIQREGPFQFLPGVSLTQPPAIASTTGEPLEQRQKLFGMEFPAIGGTPIPGAARIVDPVYRLLAEYDLLIHRGIRTPVAGFPPNQVPDDVRQEWEVEFGHQRNRILTPFVEKAEEFRKLPPDIIRKRIQEMDAIAAQITTAIVNAKYRKFPGPKSKYERGEPYMRIERK